MGISQLIVWLIVGALAGTVAGRVVTFKKEGLGRIFNLGIGMLGAVIGGFLFDLLKIDFGLGDITISLKQLVAAFVGALICLFAGWLYRKIAERKARRAIQPE